MKSIITQLKSQQSRLRLMIAALLLLAGSGLALSAVINTPAGADTTTAANQTNVGGGIQLPGALASAAPLAGPLGATAMEATQPATEPQPPVFPSAATGLSDVPFPRNDPPAELLPPMQSAPTPSLPAPLGQNDWSIVPSPNNNNVYASNALFATNCLSASDCWAVGFYWNGKVFQTLTQHWDGQSWSIIPSPNTSETLANQLVGGTCVASNDCWAVGNAWDGTFNQALIQHWNGVSWTIVPVAGPTTSLASLLTGITCTSTRDCWAVGTFAPATPTSNGKFASQTLIEHWDGVSWVAVNSPNADSNVVNVLQGVTCASATSCWAVGGFGGKPLIEHWDGTSWTIVAAPNPSTSAVTILYQPACTSASDCWVAGLYGDNQWRPLLEHWDGNSWSIVASPNPTDASGNTYGAWVQNLTCASAQDCWASGQSVTGQGFILHWDGNAWSVIDSPAVYRSPFYGLTCSSSSNCWAVGYADSPVRTLIEHWDGARWSLVNSPNAPGKWAHNYLTDIACVSASDCWAVGSSWQSYGAYFRTLIEHWDGNSWKVIPSPNADSYSNELMGIACVSSSDCSAVGTAGNNAATLIEHWNGKVWSIVSSPNPESIEWIHLYDVACVSSGECWAVGTYAAGVVETLTEHWDGTSWTIVPAPLASFQNYNAVACVSAADCWLSGDANLYSDHTSYFDHWDGAAWNRVKGAMPVYPPLFTSGALVIDMGLTGIACTSSNDCWGVGYTFDRDSTYHMLLEHWNGTQWSMSDPLVGNGVNETLMNNSFLTSVACASSSNCWALGYQWTQAQVGRNPPSVGGQALNAHWDGISWRTVTVGNTNDAINGVTCPSESVCWAAGGYSDGTDNGILKTLVEHTGVLPLSPTAVVSRKTHGSAGTFEVDLPRFGSAGIESRSGGTTGAYTLVFKFANPLTTVGGATVTSGTGTVSSSSIDISDPHNYIVNLTGVTNAQTITVSLSNVNDSAGNSSSVVAASMGVLIGDVNASGAVDGNDVSAVQGQTRRPVNLSTFRYDVNGTGVIDGNDVSTTQSKTRTRLP